MLDAIGCALGALDSEPVRAVRAACEELAGNGGSTVFGGGKTSPDRASLVNGAAVRYLDFNDTYLGEGDGCHPSDNLAAVLAAAEYAGASGTSFLTALAVAYQVHCTLMDAAPLRSRGFDHVTQGGFAVASGVSKALGLDASRTANAIGIVGTALNALRVSRTGALSHWKGLAHPHTAFAATHAVFLAKHGVTAPAQVFEGTRGFMDVVSGRFAVDWEACGLDRLERVIIKKHNGEIHSQSVVEAVLALRAAAGVGSAIAADVEAIELDVFGAGYDIIGGGVEGHKRSVVTKEDADHSLPYIAAVALLDGRLTPAQYAPERIRSDDVQSLLQRVRIREDPGFTARYPDELAVRARLVTRRGAVLEKECSTFEGHFAESIAPSAVEDKVRSLVAGRLPDTALDELFALVGGLETLPSVEPITRLLGAALPGPGGDGVARA